MGRPGQALLRLVDSLVEATVVGRVQWERWEGRSYVARIGHGWAELRRSPNGPVDATSGWHLTILNAERQPAGEVDTSLVGAVEGAARLGWRADHAAHAARQLDRLAELVVPNRTRHEELQTLRTLEGLIDDLVASGATDTAEQPPTGTDI